MRITDPRFNSFCDARSAIRAMAEICPDCARPFSDEAANLGDAPESAWIALKERAYIAYRALVSSVASGTHRCGDAKVHRVIVDVDATMGAAR